MIQGARGSCSRGAKLHLDLDCPSPGRPSEVLEMHHKTAETIGIPLDKAKMLANDDVITKDRLCGLQIGRFPVARLHGWTE